MALPGPSGPRPQRIIEIGCGLGLTSANMTFLCGRGTRVLGLDSSRKCIRFARQHCRAAPDTALTWLVADVAEVGTSALSDECLGLAADGLPFDLVYSVATLHHLPPHDLERCLRCLAARTHAQHGMLAATFITFGLSSLVPREGGGGGRLCALPASPDPVAAAATVCAQLGMGAHSTGAWPAQAGQVVDACSCIDDGGGLGAVVRTGSEWIPGRYERHYTLPGLRGLVERAGWEVLECRLSAADESATGVAGDYIYLFARPARRDR